MRGHIYIHGCILKTLFIHSMNDDTERSIDMLQGHPSFYDPTLSSIIYLNSSIKSLEA